MAFAAIPEVAAIALPVLVAVGRILDNNQEIAISIQNKSEFPVDVQCASKDDKLERRTVQPGEAYPPFGFKGNIWGTTNFWACCWRDHEDNRKDGEFWFHVYGESAGQQKGHRAYVLTNDGAFTTDGETLGNSVGTWPAN